MIFWLFLSPVGAFQSHTYPTFFCFTVFCLIIFLRTIILFTQQTPVNSGACTTGLFTHFHEQCSLQWLCEKIPRHIMCRVECYFHFACSSFVCHKKTPYVELPHSSTARDLTIFREQDCTFVILVDCCGIPCTAKKCKVHNTWAIKLSNSYQFCFCRTRVGSQLLYLMS